VVVVAPAQWIAGGAVGEGGLFAPLAGGGGSMVRERVFNNTVEKSLMLVGLIIKKLINTNIHRAGGNLIDHVTRANECTRDV
jgi:hypothetical protein